MKALGLIETKGTLAAVEAADALPEQENAEIPEEAAESEFMAISEKLDRLTLDSIIEKYGVAEGMAAADRLKVTALRTLAREYGELKISGREVSRANKQLLLEELKNYYENRND